MGCPYVGVVFGYVCALSAWVLLATSFTVDLTINMEVKIMIDAMLYAAGTALLGWSGDIVPMPRGKARLVMDYIV